MRTGVVPVLWAAGGAPLLPARARGDPPAALSGALACSEHGPVDATTVPYGQTGFVVFVNPAVNDINTVDVAAPDTRRRDSVTVAVAPGQSDITDSAGVATLTPVAAGTRILSVRRDSVSGQAAVSIAERDLREVAVSLTPDGAAVMTTVLYAFGGRVVDVSRRRRSAR